MVQILAGFPYQKLGDGLLGWGDDFGGEAQVCQWDPEDLGDGALTEGGGPGAGVELVTDAWSRPASSPLPLLSRRLADPSQLKHRRVTQSVVTFLQSGKKAVRITKEYFIKGPVIM